MSLASIPQTRDRNRVEAHERDSRRRARASLGVVVAVSAGLALNPVSAQVTDLSVNENGQDAVLTWGTGASPYRVYRSASPDFFFGNRVVAQGLAAPTATDPSALQPGSHSYYYAVYVDGQSDPQGFTTNPPPPAAPVISEISPDAGQPGDTVVISGSGFLGDGSRMIVTFQHAVAEILTATETSLQVVVPEGAQTGSVLVCIASDICSNPFPFFVTFG
ncbi:MAG: IPT/TIG domain-containing protein, partial [Thermoanaerobaculia bacterium]|nr:IPT/TIG domain-containing protein [Thermoanaerobaculia bacterium]